MRKCVPRGYPVHINAIWLTVLLLLAATSSGFGQPSAPRRASAPRTATGAPTAASLAYPQSVFVDSQHGNVWVTDFDNNRVLRFDVLSLTGIARGAVPGAAETYGLAQNYPNPFNPGTTITFALQSTEHATVKIYNVLGQEVVTLFDRLATAHTLYALWFDATNRPSGTYFYVLRSAGRLDVKKMCFVK